MKIGIVCEGGAMRGVFTAGVLQAFLDEDFNADLLVGVSAGASNGISFVSRQSGRCLRTNVDYIGNKKYLSLSNFLRTGSIFGWDFIFGEIPEKLDPFDMETFRQNPCEFYAGITDVETGECIFFGKDAIDWRFDLLRASCSMPFFAPIMDFNGKKYLDGGVGNSIPVDFALNKGCDKVIVILTRPMDFYKKPEGFRLLLRTKYRKYPNLLKTIETRHISYNHTMERIKQLEAEGIAIVVAPAENLPVGRFGQNHDKMMFAYHLGLDAGHKALSQL